MSQYTIYGMDTSRYQTVDGDTLPGAYLLPSLPPPPATDDNGPSISMDSLYPTLIQCFAIIICG